MYYMLSDNNTVELKFARAHQNKQGVSYTKCCISTNIHIRKCWEENVKAKSRGTWQEKNKILNPHLCILTIQLAINY